MRRAWLLALIWGCDDAPPPAPDAAPPPIYTEARAPCAHRDPLRNLYFGDLHVHTGNSFDAWAFEIRTRSADAYRFARGEPLALPPLDAMGQGTQPAQLRRPLDFAAVTDHAEFLAEIEACTTPGAPGYDRTTCVQYRDANAGSVIRFGGRLTLVEPTRVEDLCPDGAVDCAAVTGDVWRRIQQAAEAAYDRSEACAFTSFVAYEYSGAPRLANMHRNVIFRTATVPALPTGYMDEPTPEGLWARLRADCLDAGTGCDVLAIPHNGNWSNGNLFALTFGGAETPEARRAWARERASLEPLVEIFQHKGDAECSPLFSADEACAFEKLRTEAPDCGEGTGSGGMQGLGCLSRYDFLRGALQRGLQAWQTLGVDPLHLGVIAGTDTHNGTPGAVAEDRWLGHWGSQEATPDVRLRTRGLVPQGALFNPGGLTAIWAEENSRDALFEALRRREVYGTSGPRIAVRFFGGWGYPADLCQRPDMVEQGYSEGVPMGAELPPGEGAPIFAISALRDAEGGGLEQVQVIKGWVDADGVSRERVETVVGAPDPAGGVDLDTCERRGAGHDALCTVWQDPDFDPAVPAFWYVRVLETPSCRWTTRQCNALPAEGRPAGCADPRVAPSVQERAWTSPIWYLPPRAG